MEKLPPLKCSGVSCRDVEDSAKKNTNHELYKYCTRKISLHESNAFNASTTRQLYFQPYD